MGDPQKWMVCNRKSYCYRNRWFGNAPFLGGLHLIANLREISLFWCRSLDGVWYWDIWGGREYQKGWGWPTRMTTFSSSWNLELKIGNMTWFEGLDFIQRNMIPDCWPAWITDDHRLRSLKLKSVKSQETFVTNIVVGIWYCVIWNMTWPTCACILVAPKTNGFHMFLFLGWSWLQVNEIASSNIYWLVVWNMFYFPIYWE